MFCTDASSETIKHHIKCRESRSWFNNNQCHYFKQFFKSLIDLSIGYYQQGGILYASPVIATIMQYSQACKLLPVFFSSTSLLFHLYLCNLTQICFGFLKKTLWFFPMVSDGKPTPSISEPTSVQRLLYIKTNDPTIEPK